MPIPGFITVKSYQSSLDQRILSPAVWAACPGRALEDEFQGFYLYNSFQSGTFPGYASSADATGSITQTTTQAVAPPDHLITMLSGSTSTAAGTLGHCSIFSRPLGSITPGGYGVWYETSVTPASSTALQAAFFGLVNSTGLTTQVVSTVTAVQSTNTVANTISLVGFYMHGDTPSNVDAVFQKSGGTLSTVVSNVLSTSTAVGNPGNLNQQPVTQPGSFGSTCVKLGVNYQPSVNLLTWYVNGYPVAQFQPTSANFDVSSDYAGIVEFNGISQSLYCDFLGVAARVQP